VATAGALPPGRPQRRTDIADRRSATTRTVQDPGALLPVEERVLGPEHPDTLAARANLARWTGRAGDAAGARDQLAALLHIVERVLGPGHPDTLITRANLSHWAGQAEMTRRSCELASACSLALADAIRFADQRHLTGGWRASFLRLIIPGHSCHRQVTERPARARS
jgi:hypothetical protein